MASYKQETTIRKYGYAPKMGAGPRKLVGCSAKEVEMDKTYVLPHVAKLHEFSSQGHVNH